MNDDGVPRGRRGRHFDPSRSEQYRAPTPLQEWLVTVRLVLEDARDELGADEWRAFIWILADVVGIEAGKLVVADAIEATEDAA
jgi:hypothetical protein